MWGQNRETNAQVGKCLQGVQVHAGFWQPHAFRKATEAMLEITNSPQNLRVFISCRSQRQNHVVVSLGECRAVTGKGLLTFFVRPQDAFVDVGDLLFHPGEQCRPEVETDFGIVVYDFYDSLIVIEDSGGGIGSVTLCRNALVPVMVRICGILHLHGFQPRVFTRWLIKMAMNAQVAFHNQPLG